MHGAGVIVHDGRGWLLLGLQRDGWSTFSGKGEGTETPRQTALRECGEETLFQLELEVAQSPLLVSTTPRGRTFHLFGARMTHDPDVVRRFDEVRASRAYAHMGGCLETQRLGWFHVDELPPLRPSFETDIEAITAAVRPDPF